MREIVSSTYFFLCHIEAGTFRVLETGVKRGSYLELGAHNTHERWRLTLAASSCTFIYHYTLLTIEMGWMRDG